MLKKISNHGSLLLVITLWAAIALIAGYTKTLIPVDETRYVGVAWEMWLHHHWLVPLLNNHPYYIKPPLLFWLLEAGWNIVGVNNWLPHLVPALFGLGTLLMTYTLARLMWPQNKPIASIAALMVVGTTYWAIYMPMTMFDIQLTFFVLIALYGLYQSATGKNSGWLWFAIGSGLGMLSKGPVALVFTLLPGLLAPLWITHTVNWKKWYGLLVLATLLASAIILSWAIPAALQAGTSYAHQIFWNQSYGRVVHSFVHRRAWWWYLPLLPLVLFPWFLWLPTLRAMVQVQWKAAETAKRLLLMALLPAFIFLSVISSKQMHYILPLFPIFALYIARQLHDQQNQNSLTARIILGVAMLLIGAVIISTTSLSAFFKDNPSWLNQVSPLWGALIIGLGIVMLLWKPKKLLTQIQSLTVISFCLAAILFFGLVKTAMPYYDIRPLGEKLAVMQNHNIPIAHIGEYVDQYQFYPRLTKPLMVIAPAHMKQWAQAHPNGFIIDYAHQSQHHWQAPIWWQHYLPHHKIVRLWSAQQILAR